MRNAILIALAFLLAQIAMSMSSAYGYFIDELYYVACAKRLAWGYVDHPPFSIAVLAATKAVLGTSKLAIRLPGMLAVAASILASALFARRLGGGTLAQTLAALCTATSAIAMILASFASMNSLELLLWPLVVLFVTDIAQRGNDKAWIWVGVIFGMGLENKHTMIVLAVALGVGILATPMRSSLRSRWLLLGIGVALLLLLPNLLWQRAHGYPSLEFYRNAQAMKNVHTPPLKAIANQILVAGPGALFVWIAGVVWLVRNEKMRFLGITFGVLFAMMVFSGSSRPDRIAPIYSSMFAAGAVAIEGYKRRPVRILAFVFPALIGAVLAPIATPIFPPARAAAYARALGVFPQVEKGKTSPLPQPLADRTGWDALVADVDRVVGTLSVEERANARIVTSSYGVAGILELDGRFPTVVSTQNSYWLWGPGVGEPSVVIAIDVPGEWLDELFERRTVAAVHHCEYCMSWRDGMEIMVARNPRVPFASRWNEAKHFE